MSGPEVEAPRTALPTADLTPLERALAGDRNQLKEALLRVRPADIGRDLSRRSAVHVRQILKASANTVGALIPLTAQRVGIDPTVVSGPLITTLVDASGLFIYLSVASLMVAQLHG